VITWRMEARGVATRASTEAFDPSSMQLVRLEMRAEVRTVSIDRVVFHQTIAPKDAHSVVNIVIGEENLSTGCHDAFRKWRRLSIDRIGQYAQNAKADQISRNHSLQPLGRDRHAPPTHTFTPRLWGICVQTKILANS
jgi:hypothetical protein